MLRNSLQELNTLFFSSQCSQLLNYLSSLLTGIHIHYVCMYIYTYVCIQMSYTIYFNHVFPLPSSSHVFPSLLGVIFFLSCSLSLRNKCPQKSKQKSKSSIKNTKTKQKRVHTHTYTYTQFWNSIVYFVLATYSWARDFLWSVMMCLKN